MPDDDVAQRRGRRVLDMDQDSSDDSETATIVVVSPLPADFDPTTLALWNRHSTLASEVLAGVRCREEADASAHDTVSELASLLRELSEALDDDDDRDALFLVQDTAVMLQLIEVRSMSDNAPCIVFKALWCRRADMMGARLDVVMEIMTTAQLPGGCGIVNLEASSGAVELLRSVLRRNRLQLDETLTQTHELPWPKGFKYTVLVATPEMGANRCPVCDSFATKHCGRCKKVSYCSVGHQREHWKTHKQTCLS
eukprot:CAMPEP_0179453476 /NCGR_PEP_ID=MMETSP0799-20121207/37451_1 /TAXON_ID=46947 /ORGANISM="Geminigera cryophila, Strain CCMP2564" /LENGTH=253 /DNA_ID=CAMNT_0021250615 /DNA_START=145 /DNA_END=909 /DNA_ORIENTATION=-